MAEIFLSYSRRNEEFMLRLEEDLKQEGFSVWVDQTGLKRGSPGWKAKIQEEIERARCLVVVLSPEAKESRWVEREMSYAEAFGRPIFPVLAKGNKRTAVPIDLMDSDWFDARRRYSRALAELAATLQGYLRGGSPRRTVPTTSSPEDRRRKIEEVVRALRQRVAEELVAANELLGEWPEDLKLVFSAPATPTQKKPPQEEEPGGLLDRFLDFLDDI